MAKVIIETTLNDGTARAEEIRSAESWWYYWSCAYLGFIRSARMKINGRICKEYTNENK